MRSNKSVFKIDTKKDRITCTLEETKMKMKKTYNIESDRVTYEDDLTSVSQARRLTLLLKQMPGNFTVIRYHADPRSLHAKYRGRPDMHQIGSSSGSAHCRNNFHATYAISDNYAEAMATQ